ncbi:MAG: hypothetical protein ABI609_09990 [Acidobacteriota bacterium]
MRRLRGSGEGNLGCILWSVAFVVIALVCYKAIPIKINSAELYDFMIEQAKFGAASPETIKKAVVNKARELELPVTEKNLSVEKINDHIRLKTAFDVPLEFPGYTYVWHFDWEIDRPIFII